MNKSYQKINNITTEEPHVFHFSDYRQYLKAFYEFKKGSIKGYSYRVFSRQGEFKSPNILKLVIDGTRNIGDQSVSKFIKALHLNAAEGQYFATLVKMNQAKSDQVRNLHLKTLLNQLTHVKTSILAKEQYEYLSDWLYPVIRELSNHKNFSADPHWIANRLHSPLKLEKIVAAVKFLLDNGFIIRQDDGKYASSPITLETADDVLDLSIRNYHRSLLKDAAHKLEEVPVDKREFGAITFNLPKEEFPQLKEKLKKFINEIHYWIVKHQDLKRDNYVIQMNFQLYSHNK